MKRSLAVVCVLLLAGCPRREPPSPSLAPSAGANDAPVEFEDWYPEDISLPPGVEYPCKVTPLPLELTGIPPAERRYVNHVCALLIGVVQEKQILLTALARKQEVDLATYLEANQGALTRVRAEPVPEGLEAFHEEVVAALELHQRFFEQAVARGAAGATMKEIHQIPEGRTASQRLINAWSHISTRYGRTWSPDVQDSVYHHLCALDLF